MEDFCQTSHCTSRAHCKICRDLEGGRSWREDIAASFGVPDNKVDWDCPYGQSWGDPMPASRSVVVGDSQEPTKWFLSVHCRSRTNCGICRDESLPGWRRAILRKYPDTAEDEHFDCPFGVPWRKNTAPEVVE